MGTAEHGEGTRQFAVEFQKICDMMAATRPTGGQLFWAIDRMKRRLPRGRRRRIHRRRWRRLGLEREARAIHDEDVASCRMVGGAGAEVVRDGARGA